MRLARGEGLLQRGCDENSALSTIILYVPAKTSEVNEMFAGCNCYMCGQIVRKDKRRKGNEGLWRPWFVALVPTPRRASQHFTLHAHGVIIYTLSHWGSDTQTAGVGDDLGQWRKSFEDLLSSTAAWCIKEDQRWWQWNRHERRLLLLGSLESHQDEHQINTEQIKRAKYNHMKEHSSKLLSLGPERHQTAPTPRCDFFFHQEKNKCRTFRTWGEHFYF